MALCEAHNHQFGGHNAALKKYIGLTSSYYWPRIYSDILKHNQNLPLLPAKKIFHGQTSTTPSSSDARSTKYPYSLWSFQPNVGSRSPTQIHPLHYGCLHQIRTHYSHQEQRSWNSGQSHFSEWFCKFGIPAQIHSDSRKVFDNKLSKELFNLLNLEHTKMTPAHPQCNAQVEVFNKTVKKYLASFVDDTMVDWENFLPALMLSYNTSYHSTIATTLFELLFGTKPRLSSFQDTDIQRVHYS